MPASRELAELGVTAHIVHPPKPGVGWANDAVTMTYASDYHHIATMEDVAKIIGPLSEETACFVAGNVTHLSLGEDSTLWSSGPMRYRNPSGTGLQSR